MSDAAKYAQQYARDVGRVNQQEIDNQIRAQRVQALQQVMQAAGSIGGQMRADKSANDLATQYGLGQDGKAYTGGEAGLERELSLMKAKQGLEQSDARTGLIKAQTGYYNDRGQAMMQKADAPGRSSKFQELFAGVQEATTKIAEIKQQLKNPKLDEASHDMLNAQLQFLTRGLEKQTGKISTEPIVEWDGGDNGARVRGTLSQFQAWKDSQPAPVAPEAKKPFWANLWPNFADSPGGTPKVAASPVDNHPDGTVRVGNQSGKYERKVNGAWVPYTP